MDSKIICYTDGSASVAGKLAGVGGFGTYFPNLFGKKRAFTAGFKKAKVGQMEVLALLYALRAVCGRIDTKVELIVYSDSEYVVKTFTEKRLEKWKSAGWKNTSGEVANKSLWVEISDLLEDYSNITLTMKHIKSHQVEKEKDPLKKAELLKDSNIIGNLIVDKLADYKRHEILLEKVS